MKVPNLRTSEVYCGDGKDVKDTSQIKGEAKKSAAESEKNETTQYTVKDCPTGGGLGGRASY